MAGLLQAVFAPRRGERRSRVVAGVHPSSDWASLLSVFGRGSTGAGVDVDEWTALQFSVVWACVSRISDDVAKLPLKMYRRTGERSRERERKHPAAKLVARLINSDGVTSFDWRNAAQAQNLLWGNAYSHIERNGRGHPLAIWPMASSRTYPKRVEGKVIYEYHQPQGAIKRFPRDDILHLHGLGFNGIVGHSVVRFAAESIGAAVAAERFGATFFGNSAMPSGLLKMKGKLDDTEVAKRLKESWKEVYGKDGPDRQGVAVLEEDMQFERLTVPPDEAQFLQTRQFMIPEICRWFGVPPHKVFDLSRATFSNIEQQDLAYLGDTLMAWLTRWEHALNATLLLPDEQDEFFFEFDANALVRTDMATRNAAYATALQNGWMSRNDVRAKENENPIPEGGDVYTVQVNMTTTGQLAAAGATPAPPLPDPDPEPVEPTDKQKLKKLQRTMAAGLGEAFVPMLEQAYRQLHRAEADKARRAAKKGELARHLGEFYLQDHIDHIRGAFMPIAETFVRSVEAVAGPSPTSVELGPIVLQLAMRCVDRSREALRSTEDLEGMVSGWERGERAGVDAAADAKVLASAVLMHWNTESLS